MAKLWKAVCALCISISAACFGACASMGDGDSTGNSTPPNSSSVVNDYTVTFDVNGGTGSVADATVQEGGKVQKPADPTKAYYTFGGWYNGETAWDFENGEVTANVTLTAKWVAKTYTVKFVDFNSVETVKTYTIENVDQFAFPAVPDAPEHYENARWNKTLAECTVYSETEIVVEAIADPVNYTVSFVNGGEIAPVEVAYNNNIAAAEATARPGFIFKGWYFNGEAYDFATPVTQDMTLVARWGVFTDEADEDSVISAEYLYDNVQIETGYGAKEEEATTNPNAGWYFDSDYNGSTGEGGTDNNKFANWVGFTLTYDGSAGTSETGRETYLVLPAIDYRLYSKVDFAYENKSNIKKLEINGTELAQYGGNNKLISIITNSNGTKLYFREINSVGTANENPIVIDLPESVANGSEGLRLNITVGGWLKLYVTEFHCTSRVLDYQAKMAAAVEDLIAATTNEEKEAALAEYDKYAAYRTEYEESLGDPDEITSVREEITSIRESVYYGAILNAENGSQAQYEAIAVYRAYCDTLSEAEKADATHQANVAAVNAILGEHFPETTEFTVKAVATVSTSGASERNIAINGNSKFNDTTKYPYTTFSYSTNNTEKATFTLNAFNYAAYEEVHFGIAHAMVYETAGSITIAGETYTVPSSWYGGYMYRMKAVISDGYLTLYEDGSQDSGMAVEPYYLQVALSESVLNGTEGLVIEFSQGGSAYAWLEVTNMIATADVKQIN